MKLIHSEDFVVPTEDLHHLMNTVLRAGFWQEDNREVVIYLHPRQSTGWLEYGINVTDLTGKRVIYIGAIQRHPQAESEFHS